MRFLRNRAAVASVVILLLITLACVFGPMLLPNAFDSTDWNLMSARQRAPAGTCSAPTILGRDLLVRTLIGGRVSLMVGVLARWCRSRSASCGALRRAS
jgi:oligopeptide transport system permease protein